MENKNKYKEFQKYKIILKEERNNDKNNNKIKVKITNNCLGILYSCKNYYFNINKKRIKTDLIKHINKIFKTNYTNNRIVKIIIKYNNKIILKTRSYKKANIVLKMNISNIIYKKFRKIKKLTKFGKFKRNLIDNRNWNNFIINENYPDNIILLDPIMDDLEINIITDINCFANNNAINSK